MKILVFGGSGKIGAAVAWDLVSRKDVTSVGLVGRNEKRLRATSNWIGNPKIQIHEQDVLDLKATAD